MKKLTYLSTLAAAALLTACSSDTPDMPQPVNGKADSSDMMYMSLRINTPTRAESLGVEGEEEDGLNNTTADENTISNVDVFIYDGDDCVFSGSTTLSDQKALFQVPQSTFNNLSGKTTLDFYVVCNTAIDTYAADIQSDKVLNDVSSLYTINGTKYEKFVMSAYRTDLAVNAPGEKGKAEDDPWPIIGDVNIDVDRLAAKINIEEIKDSYCVAPSVDNEKAQGITFTYEGFRVNNENDTENLFLHMWDNSKTTDQDFIATCSSKSENLGENLWFYEQPKTFTVGALGGNGYEKRDFKYLMPLTNTAAEGDATIGEVTYLSFKTQFEAPESNTVLKNAMNGTNKVYSYSGYLLGSAKDLKNCNIEKIAGVVKGYYLEALRKSGKDESEVSNEDLDATLNDAEYVKQGLYCYTPVSQKYYCYFYKPIYDNAASFGATWTSFADAVKYGVVRNHRYDVKINSIAGMGYPAEFVPTELEPKDPQNYWFDITIEANPWQVRQNYFDF